MALPRLLLSAVLIAAPLAACAQRHGPELLEQARDGIQTLQSWYMPETGLYQTTGWWNSANAITVLANYSRAAQSREFLPVFSHTFTQAQKTSAGFLNKYYDDEGWWALAWVDVYDLTQRPEYLAMAEAIFSDMTTGWDSTCGGGIWWNKDRQYKNAIANELFLSLAAHLARRATAGQRGQYLAWARREWAWFSNSGMINQQKLINDGLDSSCQNNQKNTWTYNQGVILGGLAELYRAAPDPSLPAMAQAIANAALTHLTDANGILHDSCEPNCGADGVQFKGIFLRNLMALDAGFPDPRYAKFARANAESIWEHAQGPDHEFGQVWSGPFDTGNAGSQSSALDAFVAAVVMQRKR